MSPCCASPAQAMLAPPCGPSTRRREAQPRRTIKTTTEACGVPGRFVNVLATAWSGFIPQPAPQSRIQRLYGKVNIVIPSLGETLGDHPKSYCLRDSMYAVAYAKLPLRLLNVATHCLFAEAEKSRRVSGLMAGRKQT